MGSTLKTPALLSCQHVKSRDWDMTADGITHASLRFDNMFGSRAVAEAVDGRWTFKRNGFFNTWVGVRKAGSETDIAAMRRKGWSAAEITLLSGPQYAWRKTKRVRGEWGLYDLRDRLVMTALFKRHFLKVEGSIMIEPAGTDNSDLPMLMLLCWYWLVLRDADEQASVVSIVAVSG
ncbi:MAG: hypothetical protein IPH75_15305 [bacterium]|nr:hypothetical protein [bacterium]